MKTPISYYGGKQTMLKHIMPLIPPHKQYTESFCGGAAVLFAKRPSDSEVINDINMEITNFYWVAKVYFNDLKMEIDKTLHSRDMHDHAAHIMYYPQFFTAAQRAWLFGLCPKHLLPVCLMVRLDMTLVVQCLKKSVTQKMTSRNTCVADLST